MLIPYDAEIINNIHETQNIFTLHLRFTDPLVQQQYCFSPGQFNMLSVYGIGEVPISIVDVDAKKEIYEHTIRNVGYVTSLLFELKSGDHIGVRGAFGKGWPMKEAEGKDVIIVTGGLGCAPVVSSIQFIAKHRESYGNLTILHGMKCSGDLIYQERYREWKAMPHTQVQMICEQADEVWQSETGLITSLIQKINTDFKNTLVMICGPEIMMQHCIQLLLDKHCDENNIYLSMERNMQCGIGKCGHCQMGELFVCQDGPVFHYPKIKHLFHKKNL